MAAQGTTPAGIDGSTLPGPYGVGRYAAGLRDFLRARPRVQLFGEVWNLHRSSAKVYLELRDADGALPCSMWRDDFDALALGAHALADGVQVVVAGGLDYYAGSRTSSPAFTFAITELRIAGEGDLLAQLDRLRKTLDGEGLFAPQKALRRPALPRTIGVVTGEGGKARDDVLAGLRRRRWQGRVVWAFAPVQDRHAAPRITAAVQELAATRAVDVIVVARGGGSLADLFCFCDETLCRTVALLGVPVIASVGHHTDRTLIDDVAALSCSTPTHAAESAVPVHCAEARAELVAVARRLSVHAGRALLHRAHALARLSRAPGEHIAGERRRLHQRIREIRAAGRRRLEHERVSTARKALVLERKARAGAGDARRATRLDALALALAAHDPDRTLERGYALVTDRAGELVTSAAAARRAHELRLRFGDAAVDATITSDDERA
ncbi:MAG TPA: exodeoxyribonuclease VII large subunit [Solirubrobacteraceae bacterium]|nr:exodeoxyribonuclease VII large subunit [Solirubrobacteraceae bacterium]